MRQIFLDYSANSKLDAMKFTEKVVYDAIGKQTNKAADLLRNAEEKIKELENNPKRRIFYFITPILSLKAG